LAVLVAQVSVQVLVLELELLAGWVLALLRATVLTRLRSLSQSMSIPWSTPTARWFSCLLML
ncbi:hypothetical protein BGZ52_010301, partial [Haplosporangium bisporale]